MSMKACLFDIGQVLIRFDSAKLLAGIAELINVSLVELRAFVMRQDLAVRYETGLISTAEFAAELEKVCGFSLNVPDVIVASGAGFEEMPGMLQIIEGLKEKNIDLVLLSNTCDAHWQCLQNFPIIRHFTKSALSFEVQSMKPDHRIYQRALELAGVKPEECFYTDDLDVNIMAARQLGIKAEVFTTPADLINHLDNLDIIV